MFPSNSTEKFPSMSQADAERGEFGLGDGTEGVEVVEAGLQAIGQVLLETKIRERLEKVLVLVLVLVLGVGVSVSVSVSVSESVGSGSHGRGTDRTGEGKGAGARGLLAWLSGHVKCSPKGIFQVPF
jgi:hypothetical protein